MGEKEGVFGRLLDRMGYAAAVVAFGMSAFFASFVFLGGLNLALVGMILWGLEPARRIRC